MPVDYSKALQGATPDPLTNFNPDTETESQYLLQNPKGIKKKKRKRKQRTRYGTVERFNPNNIDTKVKLHGKGINEAIRTEMADRRDLVWEHRLAGVPVNHIGKLVGVDTSTVKRDLRASLDEARANNVEMAGRWLDLQLVRQEQIRLGAFEIYKAPRDKLIKTSERLAALKVMAGADTQIAMLVGLIGPGDAQRSPQELTGDREAVLAALADRLLGLFAKMPAEARTRLLEGAKALGSEA